MSWRVAADWTLSGNYAWMHARDEKADDDVGLAPTHQLYLRADWAFARQWNLNAQVNGVFGRKREPLDPRPRVDDYVTLDLTVRGQDFRPGWDVRVSARNVLNSGAREPSFYSAPAALIPDDLPLAGRSFFVELSRRFE